MQLEWPTICEQISKFAHFDMTKKAFTSINLIINQNNLIARYNFHRELRELCSLSNITHADVFFSTIPSNTNSAVLINKISKDSQLDLQQLNQVISYVENIVNKHNPLHKISKVSQLLTDSKLKNSIKHINSNFVRTWLDTNAQIIFDIHPELSQLKSDLGQIEKKLKDTIATLFKSPQYKNVVQFEGQDYIHDHFVIPVKSDHYNTSLGPIISRSNTGQTLYVEPLPVRQLSQKRFTVLNQIDQVINRLCRDTTHILSLNILELRQIINTTHFLDLELTKALYSNQIDGCLPKINTRRLIQLIDFYHPLIDKPVANSLTINADINRGIAITGPNTGGKSVFLKTFCICQVFLSLNISIPAKEANLFAFDSIVFLANDGQSILEALSSFSYEASFYLNSLKEASENTLFVIDEIFNSTSSDEASALAYAFIQSVSIKVNSFVLVSTHHQKLKEYIAQDPNYISCHMAYDNYKELPSYKIVFGTPGNSNAIKVFKHIESKILGSNNISSNANQIYVENAGDFETKLDELQSKISTYEKLSMELEKKQFELDQLIGNQDNLNRLKQNEFDSKLKDEWSKFKVKCDKIISQLKLEKNQTKSLTNQIFQLRPDQKNAKVEINEDTLTRPTKILLNNSYFYPQLSCEVTITKVNPKKNLYLAQSHNMKIWVKPQDLRETITSKNSKKEKVIVNFHIESMDSITFDARGLLLDDFKNHLEQYLLDLDLGHIPFVEVIHGHGDGILKNYTRDFLRKNKQYSYQIPEHSKDGSTKIFKP